MLTSPSVVHPAWIRTPEIRELEETGHFREATLPPEDVATAVVNQLLSGNSGQVFVPQGMAMAAGVRGFPHWLQLKIGMGLSAALKPATDAAMERKRRGREVS